MKFMRLSIATTLTSPPHDSDVANCRRKIRKMKPERYTLCSNPPSSFRRSLFLSGSTAAAATTTNWRAAVSISLDHLPISIYNSLRPDWGATWIPDISFAPFREQVELELRTLESVDVITVHSSLRLVSDHPSQDAQRR